MSAAKLSEDVIVRSITDARTTSFDVSPDALIALKKAGVSERIIELLQARARSAAAAGTDQQAIAATAAAEVPSSEPCRIFITEEEPPSRSYTVVEKEIQAGKKFYGAHDDALMTELARRADKAGADAIIKFHEWRAPSKWSWAAAKAGGMAVKWTTEGRNGVSGLKGQCWTAPVGAVK
jgi:hypothetical protein